MDIPEATRIPIAIALLAYVAVTAVIAWIARSKVHSEEDFLVAGRKLSFPLATATLLATWFGAGTMLAAADEVRSVGTQAIALEPIGAGLCLVVAGLFYAKPLWEMQLLTLGDFFARQFGKRSEVLASLIMVPGYFGWIAVQFVALGSMVEMIFGVPLAASIFLVALVGTGYTLVGGMWAVTLTDALQMVLLLGGLLYAGWMVTGELTTAAGSVDAGLAVLPPGFLDPLPRQDVSALLSWTTVLLIAMLGNIPGQDLLQRVFAAKSSTTAKRACIAAGLLYLSFGMIPVWLGIVSRVLLPGDLERAVLPTMFQLMLTPAAATILTVALASAVLSTIDSAILSPASILAKNVLPSISKKYEGRIGSHQAMVVVVALISLVTAYLGESAYSLLESAYAIGLCALFVPLTMGLFYRIRSERAALCSMGLGLASWAVHLAMAWEQFLGGALQPLGIASSPELLTVVLTLLVYLVVARYAPDEPTATDHPA